MEITDRDDLGQDVRAPQTNASGRDEWSYTLVTYTQPGDIVFHWHKSLVGEAAIVGWSEVVGPLAADSMDWLAHGTRGRARGKAAHVDNWIMPLGGLHELSPPITRTQLETRRHDILQVIDGLKRAEGRSVYPPFYLYGERQLRAMQSYLTKFPAALLPILDGLTTSAIPGPDRRGTFPRGLAAPKSAGQGRQQDPLLRKAIEDYAVDAATAYYRDELRATDIEVLGKPYDLKLRVDGQERHVEVKGTTVDGAVRVVLTVNEVEHARRWPRTDLFVLDGVRYTVVNGNYQLAGGQRRVWRDWAPDERALHPTEFIYDLPLTGA